MKELKLGVEQQAMTVADLVVQVDQSVSGTSNYPIHKTNISETCAHH